MKNYVYVLLALLLACNSKEKGTVPNAEIPAQEAQLVKAYEQYPDSTPLLENLVLYYRNNGNYTAAIARMEKALQKDSLNAGLWDIQGTLHFENYDTLKSIAAFERAADLNPMPDLIIALGTLYAQTRNEKALALADGLILADKAKAEKQALFIKGLYYSYVGDKNKAISFFDQCLRLDYTFMDAYREKGVALYEQGKYKEALATLERATTLQNNFDEGYYFQGKCLEKLNRIPEAIEAYQTALLYDPNYVDAKDALGKLGVKS
jgi:tetratricopeptide (TPR) repeat protein